MARLVLSRDGCNREAARVSNKACQLCFQPHDRPCSAPVSRDTTTASPPLFQAPRFRQDQPPPHHPAAAGQSSVALRPGTYPLAAPQQPRLRAAPPPAAAVRAAGSLPPSSPPELKAHQATGQQPLDLLAHSSLLPVSRGRGGGGPCSVSRGESTSSARTQSASSRGGRGGGACSSISSSEESLSSGSRVAGSLRPSQSPARVSLSARRMLGQLRPGQEAAAHPTSSAFSRMTFPTLYCWLSSCAAS